MTMPDGEQTVALRSSVQSTGCVSSQPAMPLLIEVLRSLHEAEVRCCYWKSHLRLAAVLAGEADLDLLIARDDQHAARQAFRASGLKAFPGATSREHPAVESFLGYDPSSGRIVHVHAHFRLVLGSRLLKSYRLAIEDLLLGHAVAHPTMPIRLLDPASEAVLLVVRACLELRRGDPVTLRHWRRTTAKFAADRAALAAVLAPDAVRERAVALLGAGLADAVVEAMFAPRPFTARRRLRAQVRRTLAPHRRFNAPEALLRSVGRTLAWIGGGLNRRYAWSPRPWGRRAPGGGVVIAALGVDGSGKTTITREIRTWLGAEVDVFPIYFGTGDGRPSLLLLPFKLLVPLVSRLFPRRPRGSSHGRVTDRAPGAVYGGLLMVWAGILAMEKRRKLVAAHRAASRGMVVVADRFPQDQLAEFNDGPLLPRLRWAPRWLRRYEANAYALANRLPPDLVLKLEAPAATLAQREPGMEPGLIRDRAAKLRRLEFPRTRVVSVDADLPLNAVIRAVKAEVWRLL
ncbi:MAG: hypothetical protein KGL52_18055 [Rhodospirillales bacterium]|nr:hypothetical protein [Rhodospirillales bacterium]